MSSECENNSDANTKLGSSLRSSSVTLRNQLLGEWVGAEMGLSGEALSAYAADLCSSQFQKLDDEHLVQEVLADMKAAGIEISSSRFRAKMDELMQAASEQIATK